MSHTTPHPTKLALAAASSASTEVRYKPRPVVRPAPPETNVDVAHIDIKGFAALACMSESYLWAAVAKGLAPTPMRFGPRCTRWTLASVRAWLLERTQSGATTGQGVAA